MHQRVLAVKQLREEDVGMIGELRQDGEDEATLRMAPPRRAQRLSCDNAHHVRNRLVLLEEQAVGRQCRQYLLSGGHGGGVVSSIRRRAATVAHPVATIPPRASGAAAAQRTSHAPTAAPANMMTTAMMRRRAPRPVPPAHGESAARPVSVSVRTVVVRSGTASWRTVALRPPIARAVRMIAA